MGLSHGHVAQLDRASDSGSEGRGFESLHARYLSGQLAQRANQARESTEQVEAHRPNAAGIDGKSIAIQGGQGLRRG